MVNIQAKKDEVQQADSQLQNTTQDLVKRIARLEASKTVGSYQPDNGLSQDAVRRIQEQIGLFEGRMNLIESRKQVDAQSTFIDELNYQKLQVDLSSKASKLDTQTIIRSILELQKDIKQT